MYGGVHVLVGVDQGAFVWAEEVVDEMGSALLAVDDPQGPAATELGGQLGLQPVELQDVAEQRLLTGLLPVQDPGARVSDDPFGQRTGGGVGVAGSGGI